MLICYLREKHWILKSRKTIRNCVRKKYIKCQRLKTKNCETILGILPKDRVCYACVFEVVGCDLAGPLYLRDGRQPYIVLYTCTVYQVIHLELVTFLVTKCFSSL